MFNYVPLTGYGVLHVLVCDWYCRPAASACSNPAFPDIALIMSIKRTMSLHAREGPVIRSRIMTLFFQTFKAFIFIFFKMNHLAGMLLIWSYSQVGIPLSLSLYMDRDKETPLRSRMVFCKSLFIRCRQVINLFRICLSLTDSGFDKTVFLEENADMLFARAEQNVVSCRCTFQKPILYVVRPQSLASRMRGLPCSRLFFRPR